MAQTQGQGTFLLSYFTTLTLLQLLSSPSPGSGKSDFKVSGHVEPIVALVGKDAELTCCLSPNISAKDMELRWYRDQPSQAVHVHVNGSDLPEEQMPLYQGRTTFLGVHLAQGKATVKIHNISPSDNGTFHCLFKDDTQINEATLWLQVAGGGSCGTSGPPHPKSFFFSV
ncbi:butyrophilin-like protein 10 [Erinaceus europaeus]|uniref:Butyrophilin-like protein 10 n=1 Tax=Erinaceus europaeus TaxID=9365 RepID=A0A1S3AHH6_ERIEU|nr:butyrophilin-like protein 10 [Erinaceus europaeus]